jgi:hypothetical protein
MTDLVFKRWDYPILAALTVAIGCTGFQPNAEEGASRLQEQLVVDWP